MADVELDWEVEGIISPEESVSAMLKVIVSKTVEHSGTFWTWEGKVRVSNKGVVLQLNETGVPLVIMCASELISQTFLANDPLTFR